MSVAAAVYGWVASMWALGPHGPVLLLVLGALLAATTTAGHRGKVVRALRKEAGTTKGVAASSTGEP